MYTKLKISMLYVGDTSVCVYVCVCIKRLEERDYTLHWWPCCPAITLRPTCGMGRQKPLKASPNAVGETLCYLALVRRAVRSRGGEHSLLVWSTRQSADAGHLCKESADHPRWGAVFHTSERHWPMLTATGGGYQRATSSPAYFLL